MNHKTIKKRHTAVKAAALPGVQMNCGGKKRGCYITLMRLFGIRQAA